MSKNNDAYDIGKIYSEMEKTLISSMNRNLGLHEDEEKKVGFEFTQWQAEKLRSMQQYISENQDIVQGYTSGISGAVQRHLNREYSQGKTSELAKFTKIMGKDKGQEALDTSNAFFKINARKVDSLIKSVDGNLTKANYSALRRTNDAYREVIFKAGMYNANGVYTPAQAVKQALNEFEKRGINCIEYKNGSRHTISEYANMAVRTASQRAQLMGEGDFRKSIGEHLVIITAHGTSCELCAQWEGAVLIDDVYSGGTDADGDYPFLSEAMAAGLFHPNCRHGCPTYYETKTEKTEKAVQQKEQSQDGIKDNKSEPIKLGKNFFGKQDPLYIEAFSIEEEIGYEDIYAHGSPTSIQINNNGVVKDYNAKEFAEYLKDNNYSGNDIRLASCETGKGDNSFAQQLSEILNIQVKAPDSDVYYIPDEGTLFVGSPYKNVGNWRIFKNGEEII